MRKKISKSNQYLLRDPHVHGNGSSLGLLNAINALGPNPFKINTPNFLRSTGNIGSGIGINSGSAGEGMSSGLALGIGGAASTIGGMMGNGMTSLAGSFLSGAGDIASSIPGPYGAAIGAGLKVVGGITDSLFGEKVDQQALQQAEESIKALNTFLSNALSFDELLNVEVQDPIKGPYLGGMFNTEAQKKNEALAMKRKVAQERANMQVINNANNLVDLQMSDLLSQWYADGGGIYIKPSKRGTFTAAAKQRGMGVLEFASKVLANKENYSPAMVKKANFARNAAKWHAFGGDLMTQGLDFSNGTSWIGNGGTHEANPNDGVLMGIAPDGMPNLVEEGEVIYNDYVFSNRLKPSKRLRDKYKIKDKDTFADVAKKMQKESADRPNDPISKDGLDALLGDLMNDQEDIRMAKLAKEARKQLNSMSDEDIIAMQQMANQQLDMQAYADMQALMQLNPEGMFKDGGGLKDNWLNEVVVTAKKPSKKKKDKTSIVQLPNVTPIKTTVLPTRQVLEDNYTNDILQSLSDQLAFYDQYEEERNREKMRDYLLGESGYPFACGGHLKDGLDYSQWLIKQHEKYKDNPPEGKEDKRLRKEYKKYQKSLNKGSGELQTWMRYLPIVGAGIGAVTSLFDKPDYSSARSIEEAANITPQQVTYKPLGDYLTYNPLDRNYYLNQLRSSAAASRRAIANLAGGNPATAMAGILASDYNTIDAMGKLAREAEEYNLAQRAKVAEFNRGTNMYNSEAAMKADIANQLAWMDANKLRLSGITTGAQLRDAERARIANNRSLALTGLFDNLGALGQENFSRNQLQGYITSGIGGIINDTIANLMAQAKGNTGLLPEEEPEEKVEANGGKIKRKRKGLTY